MTTAGSLSFVPDARERLAKWILSFGLAILALAVLSAGSFAQPSQPPADVVLRCRLAVGRPIVQSCMQRGGANFEECRASARPKVRECIVAAMKGSPAVQRRLPPFKLAVPSSEPRAPDQETERRLQQVPTSFVAPPRPLADITAILDSEKPDPQKIAGMHAEAEAPIPEHASKADLARLYYQRAKARADLGQLSEAIADAERAVDEAVRTSNPGLTARLELFLGLQYSDAGDLRRTLQMFRRLLDDSSHPGAKGLGFSAHRHISQIHLLMGNVPEAEKEVQHNLALIAEARTSPRWRSNYVTYGQAWEAEVEFSRGELFRATGRYREAEEAFRAAEQYRRAANKVMLQQADAPSAVELAQSADVLLSRQGQMKVDQGRFAEGEADIRRALVSRLKDEGKYHPATVRFIGPLIRCLVEQSRYAEAEKLTRAALDITRTVGMAEDAGAKIQLLSALADILVHEDKLKDASVVFETVDRATERWPPERRAFLTLTPTRVFSLYSSAQVAKGMDLADALLRRNVQRFGEDSAAAAKARALLAMGYARLRRDDDAIRAFRKSVPILMSSIDQIADDENIVNGDARNQFMRWVAESYMAVLSRSSALNPEEVASETFRLADSIRGRLVQRALGQSTARASTVDSELASLLREEQDLTKQVNAQLGVLNNALSVPSADRGDTDIPLLQQSIDELKKKRDRVHAGIAARFPRYVDIFSRATVSVDEVRSTLHDDEALLSFYFGRRWSFAWALSRSGGLAFHRLDITAEELQAKVASLRQALDPDTITTISDLPPFDITAAYDLYRLLLMPLDSVWKPSKRLIVVTNGALGIFPLSLLPTEPVHVAGSEAELAFSEYRKIPWLARTHAVSLAPSAATFTMLRRLPVGPAGRETLIGFGDPIFSRQQADERGTSGGMFASRALPLQRRALAKTRAVDRAELSKLSPLPDTADELKAIAAVLGVEPGKALQLGVQANEANVKSRDLQRYRIVIFATHGLMSGDLEGLTQPALALTAPEVAGVDGDGLLTLDEILALKLNADWVVLSACNTNSGLGNAAGPATGLARAFFYAGARALLVTNWSVHSEAARQLTAALFAIQAAQPGLSRADALRRAMLELIDHKGFMDDDGKLLFSYAHPLFWAPFSVLGDGG